MNSECSFAPPNKANSKENYVIPKLTMLDKKDVKTKSEELPVANSTKKDSDRLSSSSYASLQLIDLEQNYGLLRGKSFETKTLSGKQVEVLCEKEEFSFRKNFIKKKKLVLIINET